MARAGGSDVSAPDLPVDQAAVYDRQLRVWGVEVQRKLSAAKLLVAGFDGLAAEVAKNMVLAGVGHVALMDSRTRASYSKPSFLLPSGADPGLSVAEAAAATLQAMNPFVAVCVEPGAPQAIDARVLRKYELLILVGGGMALAARLDALAAAAGVGFISAAVRGPLSYFFVNLQEHNFAVKVEDSKRIMEQRTLHYVSLNKALSKPLSTLPKGFHPLNAVLKVCADFESDCGRQPSIADIQTLQSKLSSELDKNSAAAVQCESALNSWIANDDDFAPVCSILGGMLANTLVRALSKVEEPTKNFFYYSLEDGMGCIEDR